MCVCVCVCMCVCAGVDPGKNPTGALYASKWAWSGVVVLVEVIMAMDFRYRINNV